MKEIRDIVAAHRSAVLAGKKTALATLVHVEGSSYRRPGARMLVDEDGAITGAISGGCLEGDALRKALAAMAENKNKLVVYDTTDEDDAKFGVQLGCNGIVYILFEPIDDGNPDNAICLLQELTGGRQPAVMVTLFSMRQSMQPGTCLLYKNETIKANAGNDVTALLTDDVKHCFTAQTSIIKQYLYNGAALDAFVEFVNPPIAIVIAGAGNDVKPLVEIVSLLGWHITIVDGRASQANAMRFAKADHIIVAKPREVLQKISIDATTVFVLMTHNFNYDKELLAELLKHDIVYTGILGPKKKLERMLGELAAAGVHISTTALEKIYGPVGIDIGAETPEEIALSVAAEIKMIIAKRTGRPLKALEQPIHSRLLIQNDHA